MRRRTTHGPTIGGGTIRHKVIVYLSILFVVLFHFIAISTPQDFWHDAGFTYLFADKPLNYIMDSNDVHPPFYYLVAKGWQSVSTDEYWLRGLSLIFFGLFLFGVRRYMRIRGIGPDTQAFVIMLLGISSTMLYYSLEYRNYMMGMALVAWQVCYYFSDVIQEKRLSGTYILLSIGMLYTHYYTAFVLVAQAIYVLLQKEKGVKGIFLRNAAVVAAASFPLLQYFLHTLPKMHSMWFYDVDLWSFVSGLSYQFNLSDTITPLILVLSFFVALLTITSLFLIWRQVRFELLLFFVPFLTLLLFSAFVYPVYHHRFMLFFAFGLYIIVGLTGEALSKVNLKLCIAFVIVVTGALLLSLWQFDEVMPQELHDSQKLIKRLYPQEMTIIHTSPFSKTPYEYYFRHRPDVNNLLATGLDKRERFTAGGAVIEDEDILQQPYICDGLCLLVTDNQSIAKGKIIYDSGGLRVSQITKYP